MNARAQPEDFTVGWICAIEIEFVVACELLDEEFPRNLRPYVNPRDPNSYHFGRIHDHNVVIACLPKGQYGNTSATFVASHMLHSFPAIKIGLMVGIGGGAPSEKHDIRLGDVVVSSPTPRHGGVIQYDYGKAIQNKEFEITGYLAQPPQSLLQALSYINAHHMRKGHCIQETISDMLVNNKRLRTRYQRPDADWDRLYESVCVHKDPPDQCQCQLQLPSVEQSSELRNYFIRDRGSRNVDEDDPIIHYGLIASANSLLKDASVRDELVGKHDVLCFEMEAAGLMNTFPCVVIRGICDYSDSHKNDRWQGYAAATAAAYAKELLEVLTPLEMTQAGSAKVEQVTEAPRYPLTSRNDSKHHSQQPNFASQHKSSYTDQADKVEEEHSHSTGAAKHSEVSPSTSSTTSNVDVPQNLSTIEGQFERYSKISKHQFELYATRFLTLSSNGSKYSLTYEIIIPRSPTIFFSRMNTDALVAAIWGLVDPENLEVLTVVQAVIAAHLAHTFHKTGQPALPKTVPLELITAVCWMVKNLELPCLHDLTAARLFGEPK